MSTLRPALRLFVVLTLLCGVLYPLTVTVAAQALWPHQANGSIIRVDGHAVGSELIGQAFTDPRYLWGRPSAVDNNARTSGARNWGPLDPRLTAAIRERAAAVQAPGVAVPIDLVTASASGLDPHVSPASARLQIPRIAAARGVAPEAVAAVIEHALERPTFGVLGAPRVNVLTVNLALDRQLGRAPAVQ